MVATNERRRRLRAAVSDLAEAADDGSPLVARALREIVAEPVPEDPAEDELWVHAAAAAVRRALADDLDP